MFKRERAFLKKLEDTICLPTFNPAVFAFMLADSHPAIQIAFNRLMEEYAWCMQSQTSTDAEMQKIIANAQKLMKGKNHG